MNTFHLASLALLVGLISAAPTSTYPHVDAVVPEIEFPVAVTDGPRFNLVTFAVEPAILDTSPAAIGEDKKIQDYMKEIVTKAYTCEKGTETFDIYEGSWQAWGATNPGRADPDNAVKPNTYTFFEKYSNQKALTEHGDIDDPSKSREGTSITVEAKMMNFILNIRKDPHTGFGGLVDLGHAKTYDRYSGINVVSKKFQDYLRVSHPTEELFNKLLDSMKEKKVTNIVAPTVKNTDAEMCKCYKSLK